MNTEIVQLISIACHANAVIKGIKIERFFPDNPVCDFCKSISFAEVMRDGDEEFILNQHAPDPDSWFADLRSQKVLGVKISQIPRDLPDFPDRMSTAFV